MKRTIFYLLLLLLISCQSESPSIQNQLETSTINAIQKIGERYTALNRFSGTILIAKDTSILYHHHFGLADYENEIPFTDHTAFKIGELSELITSAIIHNMVQEGKLKLSEKVSKYLPKIKGDFIIQDLLNHQSGLPNISDIQKEYPSTTYSTIEYANLDIALSDSPANNDLDYNILGLLIEKLSDKSFEKNLKIFSKKLGLTNTYFQYNHRDTAIGYLYHNYQNKGLELQPSPTYNSAIAFSSKGLKSSAIDLSKILHINQKGDLEIDGYIENDGFSYAISKEAQTQTNIIILSNKRQPICHEILNSIRAVLQNESYQLPLLREPYDIDKSILRDFEGKYALNKLMNMEVSSKNDSLFCLFGAKHIHLIPQSANQFFMQHADAAIRFLRDESGEVISVELLDGFIEGQQVKKLK